MILYSLRLEPSTGTQIIPHFYTSAEIGKDPGSSSSKTNLVSLQPVPAGDKHSEPSSKSQEIIRNHNRRPAAGTKQSSVSSPDPWPHFAVAQIGSYEDTGNYYCLGLSLTVSCSPVLKHKPRDLWPHLMVIDCL